MLTKEKLMEYLHYDPLSGNFTWIKKSGRSGIGLRAGSDGICGKSGKSYTTIKLLGKMYQAHHLAWMYIYGYLPKFIDHINGNGLDNRLKNIREIDRLGNAKNQRLNKRNKSGILGVGYNNGKWRAAICSNYKQVYLGHFDTLFEACCARKSAERKYGFHKNHGSDRPL